MIRSDLKIILAVLFAAVVPVAANSGSGKYFLIDQSIYQFSEGSTVKISLNGPVEFFNESAGRAYFVRIDNPVSDAPDKKTEYYAGAVIHDKITEVLIDSPSEFIPVKMLAANGIVYVLMKKEKSAGGYLYSVNLNRKNVKAAHHVIDFGLFGEKPVILFMDKNSHLSIAGMDVPLASAGLSPKMTIADGFAVIHGDETVEFVDLSAQRGVCVHPTVGRFLKADSAGYNLLIAISDSPDEGESHGETVFYKIFIDGAEAGRTETSPAQIPSEFTMKVDAGRYHQIKVERWNLNRSKEKYERENNIRQPRILNVYQPDEFVLKLQYKFIDGKYETVSSILKEKD